MSLNPSPNTSDESLTNLSEKSVEKKLPTRKQQQTGTALLLVTTIIWGSTFILTNQLTQIIPPMLYMALRYFIGLIGFIPFLGRLRHLKWSQVKTAIIAGILCWASYALQTYGIKLTTATKSGFITGLNVIMVPIFIAIIYKKRVSKKIWISTILALAGVSIMSLAGFEALAIGDLLVFICDIFYAFYIIYLEQHLDEMDTMSFSIIIVATITGLSLVVSLIFEPLSVLSAENLPIIFSSQNCWTLLYMGLIATTIATLTQTFGQVHISSTRAAIIYALEPIWAAFFAVLLGDEWLSWQTIIGGILIFVGILFSIESKQKQ